MAASRTFVSTCSGTGSCLTRRNARAECMASKSALSATCNDLILGPQAELVHQPPPTGDVPVGNLTPRALSDAESPLDCPDTSTSHPFEELALRAQRSARWRSSACVDS